MNRNTTVFVLCGLLLLADAICVRKTLEVYPTLTVARFTLLIAAQTLTAFFIGSIIYMVVRKKFRRQKKPSLWQAFEPLQPLRRLFVSVWS